MTNTYIMTCNGAKQTLANATDLNESCSALCVDTVSMEADPACVAACPGDMTAKSTYTFGQCTLTVEKKPGEDVPPADGGAKADDKTITDLPKKIDDVYAQIGKSYAVKDQEAAAVIEAAIPKIKEAKPDAKAALLKKLQTIQGESTYDQSDPKLKIAVDKALAALEGVEAPADGSGKVPKKASKLPHVMLTPATGLYGAGLFFRTNKSLDATSQQTMRTSWTLKAQVPFEFDLAVKVWDINPELALYIDGYYNFTRFSAQGDSERAGWDPFDVDRHRGGIAPMILGNVHERIRLQGLVGVHLLGFDGSAEGNSKKLMDVGDIFGLDGSEFDGVIGYGFRFSFGAQFKLLDWLSWSVGLNLYVDKYETDPIGVPGSDPRTVLMQGDGLKVEVGASTGPTITF